MKALRYKVAQVFDMVSFTVLSGLLYWCWCHSEYFLNHFSVQEVILFVRMESSKLICDNLTFLMNDKCRSVFVLIRRLMENLILS